MAANIFRLLDGAFRAYMLYPVAEYRMKRKITPKLRQLRREAGLPFAERYKIAKTRLVSVLEYAKEKIPYYRDVFANIRFDPKLVCKDEKYLQEIPWLTKDIVREQGFRLLNPEFSGKKLHRQKTGGSTGLAASIFYDQEALDWTAAQNILMLAWGGKKRTDREAHLSTGFGNVKRPEWPELEAKKCLVLNRYNIYTKGFDDTAQEQLLADLKTAHARIVQGHPSTLFALARYLNAHHADGSGLFEIFVSTGELLQPKQRELIEKIFNATVSNRYGACEFGVMAQELAGGARGQLQVHDSLVWPEVCSPDEKGIGELAFTALRNLAMPLIRYRMGDLGKLEKNETGWCISHLAGRVHDSVLIDGIAYPTHYIQDILDKYEEILDFQIPAKNGVAQELRLVVNGADWPAIQENVKMNFPTLPLKRIEAKDLQFTGSRGKFRYVLNI